MVGVAFKLFRSVIETVVNEAQLLAEDDKAPTPGVGYGSTVDELVMCTPVTAQLVIVVA